jgi:lysophospholipase L1-like esterase
MRKKHVILIGDSIRMGYQDVVGAKLADVASVWGPEQNCEHTVAVLKRLHPWVLSREADIVHLNAGLHDLRTIVYGRREFVVPLEHYRANVATIFRVLREFCRAKFYWATITPILEDRIHRARAAARDSERFEQDVLAYNRAAAEEARKAGVEVNDLYAVVDSAGREKLLLEDGVHFTPEGYELLGQAVADFLRKQL